MTLRSLLTARAGAIGAAILSLSACAAPSATMLPAQTHDAHSFAQSALPSKLLFVANTLTNSVIMFPAGVQHGASLGAITAGVDVPSGLAVDKTGVLYVGNFHTITEYRPGATTPFRTLNNLQNNDAIAIDSAGTIYASQGCRILPSAGEVAVIPAGSTKPARFIILNECSFMGGLAIDHDGNLIVSFFQYPEKIDHVFKFAPGASTGTELPLQGVLAVRPSVAENTAGNLFIDGTSGETLDVNVYVPGQNAPARKITQGMNGPTAIALDAAGDLFVANSSGLPGGEFIDEYAPGGSTPINTFTGNLSGFSAIAVRPAQR